MATEERPLAGLTVLDFAQFLAGPAAALRLADLGATVVKVERPKGGDLCRSMAVNDQWVGEDSLLFHTFNRGKRSVAADLKDEGDLEAVRALVDRADVMIHNFRPGVMDRIGLGWEAVRDRNPGLVYGWVTGYGSEGPWRAKPGQDLLVQAMSGLAWLSGDDDDGPVPMGLPVLDMATGANLVQGILAALVRRGVTGRGALVEVDLMSTAVDLQYEPMTAWLNGDGDAPRRSAVSNANVYGTAPYGIYATADGHLALAMTPLSVLADLLEMPALDGFAQAEAYPRRDEIKALVAGRLAERATADWLAVLEPADVWCAPVMDWDALRRSEGFAALDPVQTVGDGVETTVCPIRIDRRRLVGGAGAPTLGADTDDLLPRRR